MRLHSGRWTDRKLRGAFARRVRGVPARLRGDEVPLHTGHWRSAGSYVALTRQRESTEVFVVRETARDAGQFALQMGRGEIRAALLALDTLQAVQMARLTAEVPREGHRYDDRQRRKEELLSAAWREDRTDPRVANELDGFMTAASRRLGQEGALNASHAASSSRRMELPGAGREPQPGLDELARGFVRAREGMTLSND